MDCNTSLADFFSSAELPELELQEPSHLLVSSSHTNQEPDFHFDWPLDESPFTELQDPGEPPFTKLFVQNSDEPPFTRIQNLDGPLFTEIEYLGKSPLTELQDIDLDLNTLFPELDGDQNSCEEFPFGYYDGESIHKYFQYNGPPSTESNRSSEEMWKTLKTVVAENERLKKYIETQLEPWTQAINKAMELVVKHTIVTGGEQVLEEFKRENIGISMSDL